MPAFETSSVLRTLIRRWIAEWDINRLFPGSSFQAQVTRLSPATYREDKDLEADGSGTAPQENPDP
jgi:hypothetical protein